nr:hypothetical protein [Tanacetum cinerariifolium]
VLSALRRSGNENEQDQTTALKPYSSGVKIQDLPCSIIKDKYMMKAQVHVSKSSAISDIKALPRKKHYCQIYHVKFKEDLFTYCIENRILKNSSKPSNYNSNIVNALQEPFVVKQDPGKNSSQSSPQINHHCCYGFGDSLEDIFFHQCTCELCGKGAHYGYNCSSKVLIIPDPEPFNNQTIDELPRTLPSFDPTCYSEDRIHSFMILNLILFMILLKFLTHLRNLLCILVNFTKTMLVMEEEKQIKEEQAAKARYWKISACYNDDDDNDYTIAITPKEPDNFQSMGDEHLDTIPATESDEFIKSSVENLVPNPSESEGKYECYVSACDNFTTFSNILFDADYDFSSSDDQSFSDEDILKEIYSNPLFDEETISIKIDPHHFNAKSDLIESLLNLDSPIISFSSKIDSLFDEFTRELTLLKSILSGINETDCDPEEEIRLIKRLLYDNSSSRPPKEFISENSDTAFESFSPFPIPVEDSDSLMEEIDLSFTPDDPMPSGIEEDDYDSERDILILEELLSNDSLSLPENESFYFDISSSFFPPAKPPNGNSGILNVKVMGDTSKHKVPMPRLMFTQPTLVPNQEKSLGLLYHQGHEAFQPSTEGPMMIHGRNIPILDVYFSISIPLDKLKY